MGDDNGTIVYIFIDWISREVFGRGGVVDGRVSYNSNLGKSDTVFKVELTRGMKLSILCLCPTKKQYLPL